MSETIYDVPAQWQNRAFADEARYNALYTRSIKDPNGFWAEEAKRIDWIKPFAKVKNISFDPHNVSIKWFEDGALNAAYNCIDRHLAKRGDQIAILWEGDDPKHEKKITYKQLHAEVCRFANVLKARGVKKGDRVGIYLPMIPEVAIAMLACARIGAVHSVVFGGFSAEALRERMSDAGAKVVVTSDGGWRKGAAVPLKANVDQALDEMPTVEKVIVAQRTGKTPPAKGPKDVLWTELISGQSATCEPE